MAAIKREHAARRKGHRGVGGAWVGHAPGFDHPVIPPVAWGVDTLSIHAWLPHPEPVD
jgi:hypothetical protein